MRRGLYRNTLSYFGGVVMVGSALLIAVSAVIGIFLAPQSPYLGIVTWLLLPGVLMFGLLAILYGMRRESLRRRRTGEEESAFPRLDLNDPRQRKRFTWALVGGSLLVVLVAFGAYNGFIFTESVTFCGRVCHTVMEPEYQAYLNSPHARVACVECHVGSGASWYVKSKLSGVRQVYAVTFKTYDTPIPVPVRDLRPARETCEHCHWPEKFYGAQLMQLPHFRFDQQNSAEQISLLLKTGGGSPSLGRGNAGIHWHMMIQNQVSFVAADRELQKIPYVKAQHPDGTVVEYRSTELAAPGPTAQPEHRMDCMDCHNRPSHNYQPPELSVDQALATGVISAKLPFIKKVAVEALEQDYASREEARAKLRERIAGYYQAKHPAVAQQQAGDIEKAVKAVIGIHERTVFPAMKVSWKTYPTNIGHRTWPGCFRCHDGKHKSADGKVLTRDCNACHSMPQRGPLMPLGTAPASQPLVGWHPLELKGKHAELMCNKCHTVGVRPAAECAGCHRISTKPPMMASMSCAECHEKAGEAKPVQDCHNCHSDITGLHTKKSHQEAACTACHKPHVWTVTGRDTCLACHTDKKDHNKDGGACMSCHEFKAEKKK
ncbi:MAG TPA: NapC/NirT family cytochrome c [Polyangia bacterium]|jgi:hypothetical protein